MRKESLHQQLHDQIDQYYSDRDQSVLPDIGLLKAISDTYVKNELDYKMLQRCLEISSQELLQANSDLREIFNVMPDLLFRVDKNEKVLDFKGGADNKLGIARWTTVGSNLKDLLPESVYQAICIVKNKLNTVNESAGIEVSLNIREQTLYYEARLLPLPDHELLLILQDISSRKRAEQNVAMTNSRLKLQNEKLFEVAVNPAMYTGNKEEAFKKITESAAKTLEVDRVGIWLYDDNHTKITCVDLFQHSSGQHSCGDEINTKDYPAYFSALAKGRTIAACDAHTHSATKELLHEYLIPKNVKSLLNAPIRTGNRYIGIICHEHTKVLREWTPDEHHFAASLADITSLVYETNAKQKAQQALMESEERFRILSESSNSAIFAFRKKISYANPAMEYLSDYTQKELCKRSIKELFGSEFAKEIKQRLTSTVDNECGYVRRECMLETKHGEQRWLFVTVGLVQLHGEPTYLASAFDITERKLMEEQLRHQAFHDKLTGLPNRALFMDRLEQCLNLIKRYSNYKSAVLFLDIDRFKVVNDSLGHLVGDKLLCQIGARLRKQMRECDTVARLGGDEFTVLIGDAQNADQAVQIALRIQGELAVAFNIDGYEIFVTASIGIAIADSSYQQADHILRDADIAMYRAKAHGKACHEVFNAQMHRRAQKLQKLETNLRRAIRNQDFELYYQPIISLKNGKTESFEALLRWNMEKGKVNPPAEFIPLAEETGLIIPLGDWVIEEACNQLNRWQIEEPDQNWVISVNLSGKQFENNKLIENITYNIHSKNIDARNLVMELTESTIIERSNLAQKKLAQLKELNIDISIDDFGTGYSSLSHLHKFPISTLKIDRSFITEMGNDGQNTEIVNTIISMAHSLGLKVVAEGVETEEQLGILLMLNCDFAQGYYFSKPVEVSKATKLVHKLWPLITQRHTPIATLHK